MSSTDLSPPGEDGSGSDRSSSFFLGGGSRSSTNHPNNDNTNKKSSSSARAAASQWAGSVWQSTQHSLQQWTVRKYTLPDKHVASQVLMYRQLLHTACRPNLILSRDYQGTPAQQAVLHMPWWSQGILQSQKMVISYQNLLARLWIGGACTPYGERWQEYHVPKGSAKKKAVDLLSSSGDNDVEEGTNEEKGDNGETSAAIVAEEKKDVEEAEKDDNPTATTTATEHGDVDTDAKPQAQVSSTTKEPDLDNMTPDQARFRAPVPHRHWVDRLGFQQQDPVTDFRSGGILSLAMMVHLVESCPQTHRRFILNGDAAVLPFGLTCINITDMMAKFLMLSKSVDRMDALLSQKPFWRMFADPDAMLVCQETAMALTADVVVELQHERGKPVTVFDFALILQIVEQRMEYDYLLAGPTSSQEMRKIHARNKIKYRQQLQQRIQLAQTKSAEEEQEPQQQQQSKEDAAATSPDAGNSTPNAAASPSGSVDEERKNQARMAAVQAWKDRASSVAGNVWQKVKTPGFHKVNSSNSRSPTASTPPQPDFLTSSPPRTHPNEPTMVVLPPQGEKRAATAPPEQEQEPRWNVEGSSEEMEDADDVML